MNVGLLIIATGKYGSFVQPLLSSARKHFLKDHKVTYYIFTDDVSILSATDGDIVPVFKEHKPWPHATLSRYETFHNSSELLSKEDYLFYCDADMRFASTVGDEILGDRVATIHPGFVGKRGTPETRKESLACVTPQEEMTYFAGGFNGGTSENFLQMSKSIAKNINIDMENVDGELANIGPFRHLGTCSCRFWAGTAASACVAAGVGGPPDLPVI